MTTAPQCLKNSRALLLRYLDIHENSSAYPTDLDPAEVGIVGDSAHRGGYHCGRDRLDAGDDYSVVESSRDRNGLTYDSCGLDVGQFSVRVGGKAHDLRSFSLWCVAQCKARTADSRDIREIIYSPDGSVVRRWDRLGRRSSGDSSHRWHTHFSIHRDAVKAGRGLVPLFTRWLTEIGLIEAADSREDELSERSDQIIDAWRLGLTKTAAGDRVEPVNWRLRDEQWQKATGEAVAALKAEVATLRTTVERLAATGTTLDVDALAEAIAARADAKLAARLAE